MHRGLTRRFEPESHDKRHSGAAGIHEHWPCRMSTIRVHGPDQVRDDGFYLK
jgi:hypothetical protein